MKVTVREGRNEDKKEARMPYSDQLQALKEHYFVSSGFSTVGTLISTSAVTCRWLVSKCSVGVTAGAEVGKKRDSHSWYLICQWTLNTVVIIKMCIALFPLLFIVIVMVIAIAM